MSNPVIVLLEKTSTSFEWVYVHENIRYIHLSAPGSLLTQAVDVITHIRELHDLWDENVQICSPSFIRDIHYDLTMTFPTINLVPVDSSIGKVFRKIIERSGKNNGAGTRNRKGDTLFICSDASKGVGRLASWAWFSNAVKTSESYNFGVSEQFSITEAEFEGILHAIIDNADTGYDKMHIYCDSMRAVEYVQAMLKGKLEKIKPRTSVRISRLVTAASIVAEQKKVTVQWVRGHRNHRLNVGADYLARMARTSSERGRKLRKNEAEISAIMSFMPNN